jgi:peptide/nickel transport system permease protein
VTALAGAMAPVAPVARQPRGARVALAILLAIAVAAVVAPLAFPSASEAMDLAARRAPPSLSHLFGTDELGRDVLARVMVGARVSLAIGLCSALLSVALGSLIGAVGGCWRSPGSPSS